MPGTRSPEPPAEARLDGIRKSYWMSDNEVRALNGVDLEFNRGSFWAIMGPSGSGKGTISRLLAKDLGYLTEPDAEELSKLCAEVRRMLAGLAKSLSATGDIARPRAATLKPGARLLREWNGQTHVVLVLEQGFEWRGRRWRSLSAIAREITLPPSGFVCGIYARNDVQRGVHKAPANETVRGAVGVAYDVTDAEQGALNQAGVNCIRYFQRSGITLWGARTIAESSGLDARSGRFFAGISRSMPQRRGRSSSSGSNDSRSACSWSRLRVL